MTTLEMIQKVRELKTEIWDLETDIRNAQHKCDHEFPEKPLFDSKYFYARCVKCGYENAVYHSVNIFNEDTAEKELKDQWNKLILKK